MTVAFGYRVLTLLGIVFVCAAGAGWKPIGPAGGGKFDPVFVTPTHLFTSDINRVWRSADRGVSWTCIQSGFSAVHFQEIGSKLFEVTYGSPYPASRILESSDQGTTWKSTLEGVSRVDSMAWLSIQSSAFIGRYWVVVGGDGVYRSPDSGATWKRIANLPWPVGDFLYTQVLKQGATLVAVNEGGYFRSVDSGASWKKQGSGPRLGLNFQVQALGRFLFGFDADTTYRSSDFGATWQTFHAPYLFSPILAEGRDLYAVGEGDWASLLMRSSDSGLTWTEVGRIRGNQSPISSLAFAGDTLFAGTYTMGVYRSFDRGAHFEQTSLPSLGVTGLATNGKSLWAGTGGGGALFRLAGNADGWIQPEVSVSGMRNISSVAVDGETVFAAEICCALHLSRDGGSSWTEPPSKRADVNGVDAVAVKDGVLLFAANGCLYRFPDTASQWECVHRIPRPWSGDDARFLVTSRAVFLGDSAGVFRSQDAGAHWDTVNHGLQGEVHILAEGSGAIYAGGTQGFFRSEDEGDSWTRMNPDNARFQALAAVGRTLFAGNDSGVHVSLDEGKSWAPANEGMLVSNSITSLAIFGPDLYAGTGTSIWRRPLGELAPGAVALAGSDPFARRSLEMRLIRAGRGPAIAFYVPARGRVRLDLFDFSGRQIGTLLDRILAQGPAEAVMNGRQVTPGGYILRLRAGGREKTAKIALTP